MTPDPSPKSSAQTDVKPVEVSDTQLPTIEAPTLPGAVKAGDVKLAGDVLERGDSIDEFEVLGVLGRGAFGVVYRARQKSLDREVALKVAANRGSEGRTMARLEHRHIVQVFSESVHEPTDQRLLCMQLVSGVPLDVLINELHFVRLRGRDWTGADLLSIVDQRAEHPSTFDPSALRDREQLAQMDSVEATAWIGARLAEALDYAHQQGVLHRDIKPANVLVNRYGQPLLADFNIAFQSFDSETKHSDNFGGTVAYMAPEHLAAFNPRDKTTATEVDQRSDLYSLGIVVGELLLGRFPIDLPPRGDISQLAFVQQLADFRAEHQPKVPPGPADARKALAHVVARCTDPDPERRFGRGSEMMAALDGVQSLRATERDLQTDSWWARSLQKWPMCCIIAAALVPQFFGSVFNISYNLTEIVNRLDQAQAGVFWKLVNWYNGAVYPLAVVIGWWVLWRLSKHWQRLASSQPSTDEQGKSARRAALNVPHWLMLLVAIGWLPGGIIFPIVLDHFAGPLPMSVYWHFLASFSMSGLIALAYSLCGVQYVALRGLYARMWPDPTGYHAVAREELKGKAWRLTLVHLLAGSIPALAAILFLALHEGEDQFSFRVLSITFVALGVLGAQLAAHLTRRVAEIGERMMG